MSSAAAHEKNHFLVSSILASNGPFAAEYSRGTNRHTGEQMTHWDMLKKATKFEFFFVQRVLVRHLHLCLVFSITAEDVVLLRFIVFLLRFTVVFSRPQEDREAVWTMTSI